MTFLNAAPLLIAVSLSACHATAPLRTPCEIGGITLRLLREDAAGTYCRTFLRSQPDLGAPPFRWFPNGCTMAKTKEMVVTDSDAVIAHEVRHLLGAYCGDKSP